MSSVLENWRVAIRTHKRTGVIDLLTASSKKKGTAKEAKHTSLAETSHFSEMIFSMIDGLVMGRHNNFRLYCSTFVFRTGMNK